MSAYCLNELLFAVPPTGFAPTNFVFAGFVIPLLAINPPAGAFILNCGTFARFNPVIGNTGLEAACIVGGRFGIEGPELSSFDKSVPICFDGLLKN